MANQGDQISMVRDEELDQVSRVIRYQGMEGFSLYWLRRILTKVGLGRSKQDGGRKWGIRSRPS